MILFIAFFVTIASFSQDADRRKTSNQLPLLPRYLSAKHVPTRTSVAVEELEERQCDLGSLPREKGTWTRSETMMGQPRVRVEEGK